MTSRKHRLLPMGLCALIALAACGRDRTAELTAASLDLPRPAKIVTVGAAGSTDRRYPGRVQAVQRVPLSFRVGGPVVELAVSKGQRVAEGELLARIDPRDYLVQVKNLEAQLAAARAQHVQAREEYQRVRALYEHDNASKADFDRARSALEVAKAQVEATEQAFTAARLALDDTELKAPYDGIVADRRVDTHQRVDAGDEVVLFQDVGGLEVRIDVPEREVTGLTAERSPSIKVRFDALPGIEVEARVKEFGTETDPLTQTFPVTLRIERAPGAGLLPGMTASVDWSAGDSGTFSAPPVVPVRAVFTDEEGETLVWRVNSESQVEKVSVTTGTLTDGGIEVVSGLDLGDRILAAGVHFVSEGQRVRALEE